MVSIWFSRPQAPLFCRREGAVDEGYREVDATALLEVRVQSAEHLFHRTRFNPFLKATVAGLVGWVSSRTILPWSTRTQHPQDAIYDFA